jgi:hypothetical protein
MTRRLAIRSLFAGAVAAALAGAAHSQTSAPAGASARGTGACGQPAAEHRHEVFAQEGLGQVVVHAGGEASFAVAVHRQRGDGDDDAGVAAALTRANRCRGREAVHAGHVAIHQQRS